MMKTPKSEGSIFPGGVNCLWSHREIINIFMEDSRLFPTCLKQNTGWHREDCWELLLWKWLWAERIWIYSKIWDFFYCSSWGCSVQGWDWDSVIFVGPSQLSRFFDFFIVIPSEIFLFFHHWEQASSCWTINRWSEISVVAPQDFCVLPGWNDEIIQCVTKREFSHKTLEFPEFIVRKVTAPSII